MLLEPCQAEEQKGQFAVQVYATPREQASPPGPPPLALPYPTMDISGELRIHLAAFPRLTDTRPRPVSLLWPEVARRLTAFEVRTEKDGAGYSPAIYRPGTTRKNEHVEALTAVVLDIDHDTPAWELLEGFEYIAHTTFSHAAQDPHWRVVLPLARPVSAEEWPAVWERGRFRLCPNADAACKDVARFFWEPAHQPGAEHETRTGSGRVLDPDALPPLPPWLPPARTQASASQGGRPGDEYAAATEWHAILEPRGWKRVYERGDEEVWRRPGKREGVSATVNYEGSGLLYVFSSSAAPFASNTPYTKFGAFALLEHDGDFKAAAKALASQGFGAPSPPLRVDTSGRTNGHAASPPSPHDEAEPGTVPGSFRLTDYGNAERLVAQHGRDLRFCHPRNKWLVWDGKRWAEDATAEVERRAKSTVRSIYQEAADAADAGRDDEAKGLAKHAVKSEARQRLEAAIMLAASEKGIPVLPPQLDADVWALNCPNGTLNLRTGTLRPHRREDYLTKLTGVAYDAAATCPTWERFLESVLPEPDVRRFVQRAAGYSLAGDTRERILLLLHGVGRNGKSTFLETVTAAVGGYGTHAAAETLLVKRPGGIPNDIARLKGARFVSTGETDEGRRLAEPLIKELTGNDTLTARFLHAEFFDFKPELTLWLATNHRPEVRGTDKAIWDRIKLVPFEQRFWLPPEEGPAALRADTTLPARLREELPGILAWLVRGCLDWQRDGLGEPRAVTEATASYRAEEDVAAAFLDECCLQHDTALVTVKSLYAAYKTWTEHGGEKPLTQTMFGRRLIERGLTRTQLGRDRAHTWIGLGLRIEESTPQGAKERV